jgi:hypothetical protein
MWDRENERPCRANPGASPDHAASLPTRPDVGRLTQQYPFNLSVDCTRFLHIVEYQTNIIFLYTNRYVVPLQKSAAIGPEIPVCTLTRLCEDGAAKILLYGCRFQAGGTS